MIIPMKKAQIVILKEDEKQLLTSLQKFGNFMLVSDEEIKENDVSGEEAYLNRLEGIINLVESYKTKKKLFDHLDLDYSEFIKNDPSRVELVERIEEISKRMDVLKQDSESCLEQIKTLTPFEGLDIPLNKLNPTKYVRFVIGLIDLNKLQQISDNLNEFHLDYKVLKNTQEGNGLFLAIYYDEFKEVMSFIRNAGFNEVSLPKVDKTVDELVNDLYNKVTNINQEYINLENELKEISSDINELKILNDQISSKLEIKKAPTFKTQATVYLKGWVRSDKLNEFEHAIKDATNIYDLSIEDPGDDELPPTFTKNNEFVEPFEAITDMFDTPHPQELDPNPIMSVWYWLIFGMMMGDAGYGVLMFIVFSLLIRLQKPKGGALKLMKVLLYSSVSTFIWGILFGSYFGFTFYPILVEPINEPIKLMVISLIIGGAHIISGLIFKMYALLKNGKILDAIFDQLSWILVIIGIGMMFLPDFSSIGQIIAIIGAGLIAVFGGRKSKNIFGKLFGGILGLYNITGYMSDILSYSRILALILSSAVIGSVMNMLAGMVQGSPIGFFFSILIYIVGHVFNLAMGLLSAYVHDSRLQYIEFFGKFYEGGGYEFKPLTLNLKFINEINDNSKLKGEN
jgi:V/A-type H+-transporting ATPase subunit I